MAVCPSGHVSQTSDYCDTCGAVIGGAPVSEPSAGSGQSAGAPGPAAGSGQPCPTCGAAKAGRFCEECGHDFELAALVPGAGSGAGPAAPAAAPPSSAAASSAASSAPSSRPSSATPAPPPVTRGLTPEQVAALLQSGAQSPVPPRFGFRPGSTSTPAPATASSTSGGSAGSRTGATIPAGDGEFDLEAALAQAEAQAHEQSAQSASGTGSGSDPAARSGPVPVPVPVPDYENEAEAESTVIVLGTGSGIDLIAVVNADLDYYRAQVERGDIVESEFAFPKYPGERRIALDVGQVRIGRSSASRGLTVEIDLTGPPLDPAISHLHAQLLRQPDHTWTLVDMHSANGTRINGGEDPIPAETEIPVGPGDRIHLGVWTTITLLEA